VTDRSNRTAADPASGLHQRMDSAIMSGVRLRTTGTDLSGSVPPTRALPAKNQGLDEFGDELTIVAFRRRG